MANYTTGSNSLVWYVQGLNREIKLNHFATLSFDETSGNTSPANGYTTDPIVISINNPTTSLLPDPEYYSYDHLGNAHVVYKMNYNSSGALINPTIQYAADYYAFGKVVREYINTGLSSEKFKFTGKERDSETGLDYFGARYYSIEVGRFISIDPKTDKYGSWNGYNYCLDNPIVAIDPDGKEVIAPNEASRQFVLQSISYMFGSNKGYSFNGNLLIHNGSSPEGLSAGQTKMFNYFNDVLVNSKTKNTIEVNQEIEAIKVGNDIPKLANLSGSEAAKTINIPSAIVRINTKYNYISVGFEAENLILISHKTMEEGLNIATNGGVKAVGAEHAAAHEIGHAILSTIMTEFGGNYNGEDFNKMTQIQRLDWAIRFTNSLFSGKNLETGAGQHTPGEGILPKEILEPIK